MVQELESFPEHKILIGLTGTFGSGKSSAGKIFKDLGAAVVDADTLAHEALEPQAPTYDAVSRMFPKAVRKGESLDRKIIAKEVFSNEEKRRRLESVIHPFVFQRICDEAGSTDKKVIVAEVPLLYETGFDAYCRHVVVVAAKQEIIEERLQEKGFHKDDIHARWNSQMSIEEKSKRADFILNNSGTLNETKQEAEKIWNQISPVLKGEN